jgi:hypothetical protein
MFRLNMARPSQREKLIQKLVDPELFCWDKVPLTTAARTHPNFTDDAPSCGAGWFGMVWTMRNLPIVDGLTDIGRYDLAAHLAWKTIKYFSGNYHEFISPITGQSEGGTPRYCWSASLYIQAIIEYLFGVDYDIAEKRLRIMPLIPDDLAGEKLSLEKLILPTGGDTRLAIFIAANQEERLISVEIHGDVVEEMNIEVLQAQAKRKPLPDVIEGPESTDYEIVKRANYSKVEGLETVVGVQTPMRKRLKVRFGL